MTARQRMQYFPAGGGGIGPTAPGTGGASTAYPVGTYAHGAPAVEIWAGTPVDGDEGPVCDGEGTGGEAPGRGAPGAGAGSTWGSVNPHFVQKSAPSAPISPQ